MFKLLQNRAIAFNRRRLAERERLLMNQGRIWGQMIRGTAPKSLKDCEFSVFSQWGEDGILQFLLNHIEFPSRTFIEFGVEDFRESNCRFLMMNDNWRGLVIDGSDNNIDRIKSSEYFWRHELDAVSEFITSDNINDVLIEYGFSDKTPGILSVDIDGQDFWVLSAIKTRPALVITEYNAVFGPDRAISVPPKKDFVRSDAHSSNLYFGASLSAFRHWANNNGYVFIGTNSVGLNAFFVRGDLINPVLQELADTAEFTSSRFRESRSTDGNLTYLQGEDRARAIAGLPVTNVVSGEAETF